MSASEAACGALPESDLDQQTALTRGGLRFRDVPSTDIGWATPRRAPAATRCAGGLIEREVASGGSARCHAIDAGFRPLRGSIFSLDPDQFGSLRGVVHWKCGSQRSSKQRV